MTEKQVKKKVKVNKVAILVPIIIIVLLIALVIFLLNRSNNPLVGKWTNETPTTYQFDSDKTGKLIISTGEYNFEYEIKDDKVTVYFNSENSVDTEFKYKVDGDKLTLENGNGVWEFTKVK